MASALRLLALRTKSSHGDPECNDPTSHLCDLFFVPAGVDSGCDS